MNPWFFPVSVTTCWGHVVKTVALGIANTVTQASIKRIYQAKVDFQGQISAYDMEFGLGILTVCKTLILIQQFGIGAVIVEIKVRIPAPIVNRATIAVYRIFSRHTVFVDASPGGRPLLQVRIASLALGLAAHVA